MATEMRDGPTASVRASEERDRQAVGALETGGKQAGMAWPFCYNGARCGHGYRRLRNSKRVG